MLDFINNNGVLFSGIFTIIGVLITAVISILKDRKKSRSDTVKSLYKELENTKNELEKVKAELVDVQSIENAEKNIDKTHGSIYYEKFADGKSRTICGYCWEKERIKIPLVVDRYYDEDIEQDYNDGFCNSCKTHCIEYIKSYIDDSNLDEELPF